VKIICPFHFYGFRLQEIGKKIVNCLNESLWQPMLPVTHSKLWGGRTIKKYAGDAIIAQIEN
jgi:hypothetical protein